MPRMDGTGPVGTGAQAQPKRFASVQDNFRGLGRGGGGFGRGRRQRRRISFASFSGNNPGNN